MMIKQLEAKYTIFDSVEDMLAPETLSNLLAKTIIRVEIQPMNGHGGLAGGHLSYINTNDGRLVLKRMSIESDWIMFTSEDHQCRSVTLWQYGLLDQLKPHADHKIVACAKDNAGWAILMHDLTGNTFSWNTVVSQELVMTFLDVLARLHATFWNSPEITRPELGICDAKRLLDQTALPTAKTYHSHGTSPIPEWVRGGWEILPEILDPSICKAMFDLIEYPQPLFDALKRYPHTLLHGDYRMDNLAYHAKSPVLLDWQEASYTLMTTDLAWFVKHQNVQNVLSREQAVSYYRASLQEYMNQNFSDDDWQIMLDLGCCLDALRSVAFSAFFYKNNDDRQAIQFNAQLVKQQGQFVVDAMRWF